MNKILIALIGVLLTSSYVFTATADHNTQESLEKRIAPEGHLNIAEASTETAAADQPADGETVYNTACMACHGTGVAGAPKVGDADAWAPRLAKGMDALYNSGINGIPPAMPAKGMCFQCSDDDIKALVDYMVQTVQ